MDAAQCIACGACEACSKEISAKFIANVNRDYLWATVAGWLERSKGRPLTGP